MNPNIIADGGMNGPILAATKWRSNAELIRDVVRLGYLREDSVTLDATFGRGIWWKLWRPNILITHDIRQDGVDFRNLPESDNTFDVAVFDPPYVCVTPETEILTRRGWRRYDELIIGEPVLTLDHEAGISHWKPLLDVHVLPYARRGLISIEGPSHSSLTTACHRWPVRTRRRFGEDRHYVSEWRMNGEFTSEDCVPICAPHGDLPDNETFCDELVELVAWFWTEGSIRKNREGRPSPYCNIVQSHVVNPENCDRIRRSLQSLLGDPTPKFPRLGRSPDDVPRWRETVDGRKKVFILSAATGRRIQALAPGRVPSSDFICALTKRQLDLFLEVSLLADGHSKNNGSVTLGQKSKKAAEAFQFAATLAGYATSIRPYYHAQQGYDMWTVRVRRRRTFKPLRQTIQTIETTSIVWCPETPDGTWLARRNGTVWFTGNSKGGRDTSGIVEMDDRYGLKDAPKTPFAVQCTINDGLRELKRVVRPGGLILAKCQPYISSGKFWAGTHKTWAYAMSLGYEQVDEFVHVGHYRPQPSNRTRADGQPAVQQHARNNASTLFVFRVKK